ncbi:MAG TPA: DinB family protein [Anaerolineales bacterium]|nr:DinB family protein [Anaerolineales bacterium]
MSSSATLSRTIRAPREAAYRAFTTSIGLQDWCADAADLSARLGGHIFLWSDEGYRLLGAFSRLEENETIEWEELAPRTGRVRIRIETENGGSKISMELAADGDLERRLAFWDPALDNLKAVLETGLDRRVYDRPMLGILIGSKVDAENRAKYGSPVPYGVVLSGTVSGMGAEALGLEENDVLVEIGDLPLDDYQALKSTVVGRKPGDHIRVAWYRRGERMEGKLRLSGRPEPFIPATPAELAEHVRGIYDRLDGELAEILDDATEEEADFRPSEKDWSVKEILGHTIATERGVHAWIAGTLGGNDLKDWASNENSLIRAIVDVHPTMPALTGELARAERQTVAMVRHLPPEITTHKGVYANIVTMLGEHGLPVHTRMHYETIRVQLETARALNR